MYARKSWCLLARGLAIYQTASILAGVGGEQLLNMGLLKKTIFLQGQFPLSISKNVVVKKTATATHRKRLFKLLTMKQRQIFLADEKSLIF